MANIKSNIKRIGTNRKAEARNKAIRSELKTAVRAAREAVAAGDKSTATTAVANAARKIDKAVSKGVLHKKQAANRKSAIAKAAASLEKDFVKDRVREARFFIYPLVPSPSVAFQRSTRALSPHPSHLHQS